MATKFAVFWMTAGVKELGMVGLLWSENRQTFNFWRREDDTSGKAGEGIFRKWAILGGCKQCHWLLSHAPTLLYFILFDVQGFECLPQWSAMVRQILFLDSTVYQTFPRKSPWKLSTTRKANARERLKKVDAVIEAVRVSGVQCKALVRHISFCFRWVSR